MSKKLFTRNGHFYYRQWIPVDLRTYYKNRTDFAKSLKTTNKQEALSLASVLQQKFSLEFTLIRSGHYPSYAVETLISSLGPSNIETTSLTPHTGRSNGSQDNETKLHLSSLIQMYLDECSLNWTDKSHQEFVGQLNLLQKVLGDKCVSEFDRVSCVQCRDTLQKVPSGFSKKKQMRNLSIPELLKLDVTGIHPKTINKYMTLLSTLFKWANKNGHMKSNPAEGLTLKINKRPDEERKAYSQSDIAKIVINLDINPVKKFVPLVAMYTGMRLEEICQLFIEDIREIDGVLCFDVNNRMGKRLKSKSSARLIPVHPKLIEYGLLEYLSVRVGESHENENLWKLKRGKWGYGKNITNWWSKTFNRKYITKDPLKCFHSLRHSFTDGLKQKGVSESVIAEIVGHSNQSITMGRYGKRYNVRVLFDAVLLVEY